MGDKSSIEWTDATWNPVTGCDRVSPGCDNCYAATMAKRLKAMGSPRYQTDGDPRTSGPGFGVATHDDVLVQPLRWRRARKVFVNSMSDLFHPRVPDDFIAACWAVMWMANHHTFQVLTKRPKRARALLNSDAFWVLVCTAFDRFAEGGIPVGDGAVAAGPDYPLDNVWVGTSVEDQERADERVPALLEIPAAVRFLSCEPLLGALDLRPWLNPGRACEGCDVECPTCPFHRAVYTDTGFDGRSGHHAPEQLGWVIVGGESGPGARTMHPQWARDLRDQCVAAGVPFLFKQWGAWIGEDDLIEHGYAGGYHTNVVDGLVMARPTGGKHATGRQLDGRTWDEFPQAVTADA